MRGKFLKKFFILLCITSVLSALIGVGKLEVCAANTPNGSYLSGDVKELKEKRKGYVMQIAVENKGEIGEDFTGTVQVIFETPVHSGSGYVHNSVNCAYNTEITLPAQEKKQFTITLTDFTVEHSFENGQGKCALNFIDEGGNVIQSISFEKVFDYPVKDISVGVLSDNFEGLNYMNTDGSAAVYNSYMDNAILIRLNNGNIKEQLEELYFLIIDQFNVSLLSEEDIQAIQDWVKAGGFLIIGTGEYAEQTLSGFDKDFIDVYALSISKPGEKNILTVQPKSYYDSFYDGIDFTKMAVADLNDNSINGYFYISNTNPAIRSSIGDGEVMIFYFSLGENELQKFDNSDHIYFEVANHRKDYYFEDYSNISERLLASMDRDDFMYRDDFVCGGDFEDRVYVSITERNLALICFFGGLIIIIIVYGIQRKYTIRKWYWICAYVFGLIMLSISGIMFFIQNIALKKDNDQANNVLEKENRVYSVTTQRVDGNRADTYLLAYRDDANLWELHLKDNYDMASPGSSENKLIDNSYGPQTDEYYYIVSNDNKGLSVGIKPGEDNAGFFYAEGNTESKGMISCKDFKESASKSGITITNETDYDMAYMAIFKQRGYIMIFSDVKAGEALNLRQAIIAGRCVYEDDYFLYEKKYDDIMFNLFEQSSNGEYEYESDDMAALLVGIGIAENEKPRDLKRATIVGLVKDYDKVIDEECNETSYGCFYTYTQQGEE